MRDFAYQYGLYSAKFTRYVSAVIRNLSREEHRQVLLTNLAEEQGNTHDMELPPEFLESVAGEPHSKLFRRFQEAVGVDEEYRRRSSANQAGKLWSGQFQQLCETNECVGVGAIGIGTELIVSSIYNQILEGLRTHSNLTMRERIFFDLHSQCDEEHAAQLALIAEDLGGKPATVESRNEKIGHNLLAYLLDRGELGGYLDRTIFSEVVSNELSDDKNGEIVDLAGGDVRSHGSPMQKR